MPHLPQTQLPELTPPNPFADIAAAGTGRKTTPTQDFELRSIERKLAQAQLQQAESQEHRAESEHRLRQFGAISTVAKVISTLGNIPDELKETFAANFAKEAQSDNLPVTDPKFFRALMDKPRELSTFLDSFVQSAKQGKSVVEALQESSKGITDPEVTKLIGETFQEQLKAKTSTLKLGDLKAMAVQLEVGGNKAQAKQLRDAIKDIEATPQGAESRIFDALIEKNKQAGAANPTIAAANEFLGFVGSRSFAGAGGAARGAQEAKENFPLDLEAFKWINPETGVPAPASLTRKQARDKGFVPVAESSISAVAYAKAGLAQITEYRKLIPELLVNATGDLGHDIGTIQTNRLKLFAKARGGDPAIKRLLGLQGGIATLARATGDTANIAVAEREMLKEFALTTEDSVQSAKQKLDQAERILRSVVAARGVPLPAANPEPGTVTLSSGKVVKIPRSLP